MADTCNPSRTTKQYLRTPIILVVGVTLALGTATALLRINAAAPSALTPLANHHGTLMILGFVGGAISLERAVALRKTWAYLAPGLIITGTLTLTVLTLTPTPSALTTTLNTVIPPPHSHLPTTLAGGLYATGFLILTITYYHLWLRRRDNAVLIQGLGSLSAIIAALLLARHLPTEIQVPYLLFFPIFTIIGERLELSLINHSPKSQPITALSLLTFFTLSFSPLYPQAALTATGLSLLALCGFTARVDVARHTLFQPAVARFSAAGILSGYVWLTIAALIWALTGPTTSGPLHETLIHAVALGFIMPMIFAHAPIIIPAITHRPLPYHPALWVPLIAMQLGLLIRFAIGITRNIEFMRIWGGTINAAAILAFALITLTSQTRRLPPPTTNDQSESK